MERMVMLIKCICNRYIKINIRFYKLVVIGIVFYEMDDIEY